MAMFRKVFGPTRIDTDGSEKKYRVQAHAGGQNARVAMYQVVILEASGTNMKVSVILEHGPDGQNFLTHSTPIAAVAVSGTYPEVKSGDADQTKILGAWLRVVISATSVSGAQWAQVEVYELLKDF